MNPFEFVVALILIVTVGRILRARYRGNASSPSDFLRGRGYNDQTVDDAETVRLRDEVKALKDRVAVLERIATDRGSSLEHEIEQLRDR